MITIESLKTKAGRRKLYLLTYKLMEANEHNLGFCFAFRTLTGHSYNVWEWKDMLPEFDLFYESYHHTYWWPFSLLEDGRGERLIAAGLMMVI